jgi:hypothetical protein
MNTIEFPIYTKHNDFTFVMQISKHRALVAQGSDNMPYGTFEVNIEPAVHHYFTELDEDKAIKITRTLFQSKFRKAQFKNMNLLNSTFRIYPEEKGVNDGC